MGHNATLRVTEFRALRDGPITSEKVTCSRLLVSEAREERRNERISERTKNKGAAITTLRAWSGLQDIRWLGLDPPL